MKKLLFLLLLPVLLSAQHFTENFNYFLGDTTGAKAIYYFDNTIPASWYTRSGADSIIEDYSGNNNDLDIYFSTYSHGWQSYANVVDSLTTGSILNSGGKVMRFDGINDAFTIPAASAGGLNLGTGDFTWIVYGSWVGAATFPFIDKYNGSSNFYSFRQSTNTTLWVRNAIAGTGVTVATSPSENNLNADVGQKSAAVAVDRATAINFYYNGAYMGASTVTNNTATSLDQAGNFFIGFNDLSNLYSAGTISAIKVFPKFFSAREIKEDLYLATDWVSRQGNVTRNNFAFAQGITGTNFAVKVGDGSYVPKTLTASSVTYSINLGAVNLSSDSIYIKTSTDTLSHALADSTLPDGYQWTLSIDAQETGGVVYIDNLSLTTSLIPTDTGQDKGFKEHSKFPSRPKFPTR